ncbi:MAG: DUF192 domain-containing protein [Mesorhizobium sp.]
MKAIFRASMVAAALVLAAGAPTYVQQAFADSRAMVLPVEKTPLIAKTAGGDRSFTIEIADEPLEQQRGLMFRETMADDHGMLFDMGVTRPTGFWMENTPMPLDLLFIGDDGIVKAILPGQPFSRATISPGVPVRFVLELKRGMSEKYGIKPGDRLRHPAIDAVTGSK